MRAKKFAMPNVEAENISASYSKVTGDREKRSVWEELEVKTKVIFTFQLNF